MIATNLLTLEVVPVLLPREYQETTFRSLLSCIAYQSHVPLLVLADPMLVGPH